MSEEVNFFRSGQMYMSINTVYDWYWAVGQSDHFVGFSFFPDATPEPTASELRLTSYPDPAHPGNTLGMGYQINAQGNCVLHFPLTNIGPSNAFFSVSVGSVPP